MTLKRMTTSTMISQRVTRYWNLSLIKYCLILIKFGGILAVGGGSCENQKLKQGGHIKWEWQDWKTKNGNGGRGRHFYGSKSNVYYLNKPKLPLHHPPTLNQETDDVLIRWGKMVFNNEFDYWWWWVTLSSVLIGPPPFKFFGFSVDNFQISRLIFMMKKSF